MKLKDVTKPQGRVSTLGANARRAACASAGWRATDPLRIGDTNGQTPDVYPPGQSKRDRKLVSPRPRFIQSFPCNLMEVPLNTRPYTLPATLKALATAVKPVIMLSMRLPESETSKLTVPGAGRVPVPSKAAPMQLPP